MSLNLVESHTICTHQKEHKVVIVSTEETSPAESSKKGLSEQKIAEDSSNDNGDSDEDDNDDTSKDNGIMVRKLTFNLLNL